MKRLFTGGSAANEQLTAIVAALLFLLLAVEDATLLNLHSLLTVHGFVGMLLIPIVTLKLASTGWRMVRYYAHADEYVLHGPPHVVLRVLVAPVIVLSTIVVFGTGVALLAVNETRGTLVGLHKASFVVWFGATSIHVLAHVPTMLRALTARVPAALGVRVGLAAAAVGVGLVVATASLPAVDRLQDQVSAPLHFDGG
jgi:hypothetical protein